MTHEHYELPSDMTPREIAELYAAGALTTGEAAAFESRVRAGDTAFVTALQEVRPAMESLLNAAEPVTPPTAVRASLLARLGVGEMRPTEQKDEAEDENPFAREHEDHEEHDAELELAGASQIGVSGVQILRAANARWKRTGLPGVRYRTLLADRKANRRTIMLQMEAGSELPDHSHAGIEEVFMLSGDLDIAGETLHANDYIRVARGAQHGVPRTSDGCTCIVISDYVPFPMTSMLGFVWSALKSLLGRSPRR
jgi:quercetin dioxygenase-like cupin family protein